jgi:uncharacterized protein
MTSRSLTIRGIPDAVLARIRARAAREHRSLNGEVLAILARAAAEDASSPRPAAVGGAALEYGAAEAAAGGASSPRPAAVGETAPEYGPAETAAGSAAARPAAVSLLDAVDRDALAGVCRRHRIHWLAVFGSHARGDARADSDVDVVVEFAPGMTPGLGMIRVAEALRPVLGDRRVDLVTRRGLAPRLRDRVLSEARELYAA